MRSYLIFIFSFYLMVDAQAQISGHEVRVNGTSLYYSRSGKGDPLLLLHGWTQSSVFWEPYVPAFSEQFEVLTVDLRGHGRSAPLDKGFSIRNASKDIIALLDSLGLKKVRAVGLSYGGLVLLEIANMRKDILHEMVLIGTSYDYDGAAANKGKPAFSYDDLDPGFKTFLLQQHKHGEKQVRALFDPSLDYRISLSKEDLDRIKARTFIINGDADHIADLSQVAEMKKRIPDSRLWVIPRTGHMALTDEVQAEFTRKALDFFSGK